MDWTTLLAYITGSVDQKLLRHHEYLVMEIRLLRHQVTGHGRLSDGEHKALAEIGKKLGKKALERAGSGGGLPFGHVRESQRRFCPRR